jgi:hypothetical protein
MPGLVPGIHVLAALKKNVDGRDKPGHDEKRLIFQRGIDHRLRDRATRRLLPPHAPCHIHGDRAAARRLRKAA